MHEPRPDEQDAHQARYRRYRRRLTIALIMAGGSFGMLDLLFYSQAGFLFFSLGAQVITSIVLILLWCHCDSVIRRQRFTSADARLVALVGVIGVPAYFWRSRHRREFLFSLGGLYLFALPAAAYSLIHQGGLSLQAKLNPHVFLLISNVGTPSQGVYTIALANGQQRILMFTDRDDAIAYNQQLIQKNFLGLSVQKFSQPAMEAFCQAQNYECQLIPPGTGLAPPQ